MEIIRFARGEFNVQAIEDEQELLFLAKPIAETLRYIDTDGAIRRHVSSEFKISRPVRTTGGIRNAIFLKEGGLYELIFEI